MLLWVPLVLSMMPGLPGGYQPGANPVGGVMGAAQWDYVSRGLANLFTTWTNVPIPIVEVATLARGAMQAYQTYPSVATLAVVSVAYGSATLWERSACEARIEPECALRNELLAREVLLLQGDKTILLVLIGDLEVEVEERKVAYEQLKSLADKDIKICQAQIQTNDETYQQQKDHIKAEYEAELTRRSNARKKKTCNAASEQNEDQKDNTASEQNEDQKDNMFNTLKAKEAAWEKAKEELKKAKTTLEADKTNLERDLATCRTELATERRSGARMKASFENAQTQNLQQDTLLHDTKSARGKDQAKLKSLEWFIPWLVCLCIVLLVCSIYLYITVQQQKMLGKQNNEASSKMIMDVMDRHAKAGFLVPYPLKQTPQRGAPGMAPKLPIKGASASIPACQLKHIFVDIWSQGGHVGLLALNEADKWECDLAEKRKGMRSSKITIHDAPTAMQEKEQVEKRLCVFKYGVQHHSPNLGMIVVEIVTIVYVLFQAQEMLQKYWPSIFATLNTLFPHEKAQDCPYEWCESCSKSMTCNIPQCVCCSEHHPTLCGATNPITLL
jgi:hypothetical protein